MGLDVASAPSARIHAVAVRRGAAAHQPVSGFLPRLVATVQPDHHVP